MRGPEVGEFFELKEEAISSLPDIDSSSFVVVDDALVENGVDTRKEVVDVLEVGIELKFTTPESEKGRIFVDHEGVDPLPMVRDLCSWFGSSEFE